MIRRIGRELKDSSPISVAVRSCPARTPASIRNVEPLFPQSSECEGVISFWSPENKSLSFVFSIEMPRAWRHDTVEAQSRAVEKFEISDLFDASAAIRAARCEIDLSPGSRNLPLINVANSSRIFVCYVR